MKSRKINNGPKLACLLTLVCATYLLLGSPTSAQLGRDQTTYYLIGPSKSGDWQKLGTYDSKDEVVALAAKRAQLGQRSFLVVTTLSSTTGEGFKPLADGRGYFRAQRFQYRDGSFYRSRTTNAKREILIQAILRELNPDAPLTNLERLGDYNKFKGMKVDFTVTVSMEKLRELLGDIIPEDGKVVTIILNKNTWPDAKPEYEKNEYIEFALGRHLRAKPQHRNPSDGDEQPLELVRNGKPMPGLSLGEGYILLRTGWRAKKKGVDLGPFGRTDHYDGTFYGKLYVWISRGHIKATLEKEKFWWRGAGVEGALDSLFFGQADKIVRQGIEKVNRWLNEKIVSATNALTTDHKLTGDLLKYTKLRVARDRITLSISTP